ncbi:MAG: hypothetical protein J6Q32_03025 [Clostridia bacterium]|nr:hypothetical protein [Clostridia bacterium]
MTAVIIIGALTAVGVTASVLKFPNIKIGKIKLDSYWVIALIGAIFMLCFGGIGLKELLKEFTANTSVNPIKILVLFICMTILSVFLDEVGFFSYLACKTLKLAKHSQKKLFIWLYIIVSILTVFTSNDIIVLTFTPFICHFAKNAKINPLPYLVTEFVAANTMSMTLIIGNPTNIFIATSYGINFLQYFKVMILPTLACSLVAFLMLYLVFRKQLCKSIEYSQENAEIKNKPFLVIGLILLAICVVVLAIGPYLGVEMYLVSLVAAVSLVVVIGALCIAKKHKPTEMLRTLKRAPWQLIPFVISMFIIILSFNNHGVTEKLSLLLGNKNTIFTYGISSFLSANVINNIPMSVLFCNLISPLTGACQTGAIYATVIGSNVGAFLTPIGALAGIMWSGMLKKHEIKFSYAKFLKYGAIIAIPTIISGLLALNLVL